MKNVLMNAVERVVLSRAFRPKFRVTTNSVHVVSLSCNPVPPERYGGIELVVAHLCEGLALAGAKVVCYSPGDLGVSGVEHCRTLVKPSLHIKSGGAPNVPEHLEQIAKRLAAAKPGDVVVFNHADHYRGLKRRLKFFRSRLAMCEVAHWVDVGLGSNIIYPSSALMNQIGKPGLVIPHGEKLLFCDPVEAKKDYLFFAGRITKDKGVDIALAACRELGVPLVLAGPLSDPGFSQTIIRDPAVRYLGELTYPELVPYYAGARALVYMTQYTEPFGLSIIEAMAAGCPVLTTGKGGTGETVVQGKTGFFCQSAAEIVAAYSRLPSLRPQDCIERAKAYSVQQMSRAYLDYFQSL